jgi:hypothetical protein
MVTGNKDGKNSQQNIDTLIAEGDPGVAGAQGQETTVPKRTPIVINPNNLITQKTLQEEAAIYPRPNIAGMDSESLFAKLPQTVTVQRGPGGSKWFYTGEKLVDEDDAPSRPQYDLSSDINTEFFKLKNNEAERNQFFKALVALGYYGENGKPSPAALYGISLSGADTNAIGNFMVTANDRRRTMKALVNLWISGDFVGPPSMGTGRTVSVVSREDAAKQTGDAFFQLLGRAATPAEVKIAVQAIQDMDRQRQLSNVEDPTTLGVAAEQQAMKASPGEFGAYSAGKAINQVFSLLGGA